MIRPGLLVVLVVAVPAAATTVTRGPLLQQPSPSSVIVVFDLDEAVEAEVRVSGEAFSSGAAAMHHEVEVTGLDTDTVYPYGVYSGDVALSEGHQLTTAVAPGSDFRFVAIGDTRSGHEDHAALVAAIQGEDARFVLHTGDLVSDGEEVEDWDQFFEIEDPMLHDLPLFPVLGNHDEEDGEALLYEEAFALPGNELYYSFDFGNAHFVVLDQYVNMVLLCTVDEVLADNCLDEEQLAWLEADLAAASETAEVIFASAHIGAYSSKAGRSGNSHLRALLPWLASLGVDVILTGHDHYYERGFTDNGLPYVITGGGGAGLYTIGDPSEDPHTVAYNESVHHYVVIEVTGPLVRFTTRTADGTVIDEAEIDVSVAVDPPVDDDDAASDDTGLPESEDGCGCGLSAGQVAGAVPVALLVLLWVRSRR